MTREILLKFAKWTKIKYLISIAESKEDLYFYEREIWWASLGANIGFEQDGKNEMYERPVLVFKKFNENVFWALPLTSKQKEGKYYLKTEYNGEVYNIILSQLRLISSKRLLRNIRTLPENEFNIIKYKIKEFL